MKTLVIIVTFNGMRWLRRCMDSVYNLPDTDVYVVDNMSSDGSADFIAENYPGVVLYRNCVNTGFGAANNIGLRYALNEGYDYVYLLNQDAWVKPDCIGMMIEVQKENPRFGILSPLQYQDGYKELTGFFERLYMKAEPVTPDLVRLPYIMAAHWLISRDCLLKTGLFSPVFPFYGEDDNLCDRARYKGFEIGIVKTAMAVHDIGRRKASKDKKIRMSYYMKVVSDISRLTPAPKENLTQRITSSMIGHPRLYAIVMAFVNAVRFGSLSPFGYMKKILAALPAILSARQESRSDCPFL